MGANRPCTDRRVLPGFATIALVARYESDRTAVNVLNWNTPLKRIGPWTGARPMGLGQGGIVAQQGQVESFAH